MNFMKLLLEHERHERNLIVSQTVSQQFRNRL